MKINTFFAATICAGTLFTSCVHQTAQERQLKYTHTSLADGDAFAIIQRVGETVLTGAARAEQIASSGDAQSKEVAAQVKAFYTQFTPSLDSIATAFHIDFPIRGIPALAEADTSALESTSDTTLVVEEDVQVHAKEDYVHMTQHDVAFVKEQLTRLSRNTNKDLQNFAHEHLPAVSALYTQIGGQEDAHDHAHH